jgi:hypothetical protein
MMNMTPRLQKLTLLAHISFSVGWFGAIIPYIALAVAGLTSHDNQLLRATYISMELIGWYVLVPLSIAALLSGLVQALGTRWGLLRHWWIVAKFLLTIFAVAVLFRHMEDVSQMARAARETFVSSADFRPELIHSVGGSLVLFIAIMLSVFKPWGATPFARRETSPVIERPRLGGGPITAAGEALSVVGKVRWSRFVGIHAAHAVAIVLLAAIFLHLTGHFHQGVAH